MVKNTKTWISWERNIIFLQNKKVLNLCLRWHILKNYRFVAEVTFKWINTVTANLCDLIEISKEEKSKNYVKDDLQILQTFIASIIVIIQNNGKPKSDPETV